MPSKKEYQPIFFGQDFDKDVREMVKNLEEGRFAKEGTIGAAIYEWSMKHLESLSSHEDWLVGLACLEGFEVEQKAKFGKTLFHTRMNDENHPKAVRLKMKADAQKKKAERAEKKAKKEMEAMKAKLFKQEV
jgi:hypothetical protein